MKFLTKEVLAALPPLYANEEKANEETLVPLKLFNPVGAQTWYVTEYDPESGNAFGYATGIGFDELGYISIPELEATRLPLGLRIERDLYWDPKTTLAQVISGERK